MTTSGTGHDVRTSRRGSRPPAIGTFLTAVAFLSAIVVLAAALRPSPRSSLERHWRVFGERAAAAVPLLALGTILTRGRARILAGTASVIVLAGAALCHPVCDPIPDSERPDFETVIPLRERARRGEPFCELDGHWYQCKAALSRALFF